MNLGNGVEIDFSELSPEKLHEARAEVTVAGEAQGLWVPEGAGSLVVAETVQASQELRNQILANAETEIEHTNRVFEIINTTRRNKRDHLPITPAGEHQERLKDQLSDRALEAATQLHHDPVFCPLMPVPPLPGPITAEELITAVAKSSRRGLDWQPSRIPLLKRFPIDALSGYDPERAESGALSLVETGADILRQGSRDQQLEKLREVQEEFPEIGTAPILASASLSHHYNFEPISSLYTYTKAIEADPIPVYYEHKGSNNDCVVSASTGHSNHRAHLHASSVLDDNPSRWQVTLEA